MRVSDSSSALNSTPSICSVAAIDTVLPASLLPVVNCFIGRTQLHALGGGAGFDFVAVEQHTRAGLQQSKMAVHGVLVQRDEDIQFVAHVADGPIAGANGEERVPAAYEGLIGVVGVEIEPAPGEDARENVPGRCDTLSCLPADSDCKVNFGHRQLPFACGDAAKS